MEECVLTSAKSMFGDTDERLGTTVGYSIRTEDRITNMDKRTGQGIIECSVEGCSAELEVYPNEHTPNIYHVEPESLSAARFVCKVAKEN